MTYYIQCPHCGAIIETTNYIPEDMVCYGCGEHYIVNKKNSMLKPPFDLFYIICMIMVGCGGSLVIGVINGALSADYLIIALLCIASAIFVYIATECTRKTIETKLLSLMLGKCKRIPGNKKV